MPCAYLAWCRLYLAYKTLQWSQQLPCPGQLSRSLCVSWPLGSLEMGKWEEQCDHSWTSSGGALCWACGSTVSQNPRDLRTGVLVVTARHRQGGRGWERLGNVRKHLTSKTWDMEEQSGTSSSSSVTSKAASSVGRRGDPGEPSQMFLVPR